MEKNTETLKALRDAAIARDHANLEVEKAVGAARAAGASWADIAMPLGITRQAAQQKYSTSSPELIAAHRAEDRAAVARYNAANQDTTPATPSIFVAPELPATVQTPAGKIELGPEDFGDEQAERADFWESKRRYAVTECGAIYAPTGEHGWQLESVVRNVRGKFHKKTFPGMAELLHEFDGVLWINRDRYEGMVKNAAHSRETWIIVAADKANKGIVSVSAHRELSKEIDAMTEKLTAIDKTLKTRKPKKLVEDLFSGSDAR